MYVAMVEEVGELRGVPSRAALLDDLLVGRGRRARRPLLPMAIGFRGLGVGSVYPANQAINQVLVLAPATHRTSPVTVKKRSWQYISIFPPDGISRCVFCPRIFPSTMMCTPAPEGETSM